MKRMNHPRLLVAAPIVSLACVAGCISDAGDDPELELATAVSELACTATKLEAFSSAEDEGRLVFSPDGKLALLHRGVPNQRIMESRRVGGAWTAPAVVAFSGTYSDSDPFIARDGRTVLFSSNRPHPGETEPHPDTDLWTVTRTAAGGWTTPVLVPDVNTDSMELFPSTTADGTLYFNSQRPGAEAWDIFIARPRAGGGYHPPVRLPGAVNTGIWEYNPSPSANGFLLAFASLDPDPAAPYSDVFFSVWLGDGYSERIAAGTCVNTVEEEYHPTLDLRRGRLIFVRNDPFSPGYPQGDFYSISLPGALLADAD